MKKLLSIIWILHSQHKKIRGNWDYLVNQLKDICREAYVLLVELH